MQLKVGMMVTSNLKLVRLIGRGGMGSVWIAHHRVLDAEVAVKFLHRVIQGKRRKVAISRFQREATIAAKLRCPHAAQTFDSGVLSDGTPYIVMELLEGESLAERLARVERLTLKQTMSLVEQSSKVLTRAHEQQVAHRDIKPANMFLVDSGYDIFLKLLDFGLAKQFGCPRIDGITVTGALLGSPSYMSPEQIVDPKRVDHRCDLWSLAVVVYRCLTGRLPFEGNTLGETILAVTEHDMVPASTLRPSLPLDVDDWFAKAFHRNIDERFQSSAEMCEALKAAMKSRLGARRSTIVPPAGETPVPPERLRSYPSYALSDEHSRRGLLMTMPHPTVTASCTTSSEAPLPPTQPSWISQLARRRSHYVPIAALLIGLGGAGAFAVERPLLQPTPVMAEEGLLSVPDDLGSALIQPGSAQPARYQQSCAGRARDKCLRPPSWPDTQR